EAIRVALKRLGIRWRRAKHWITSPDPAYARKKSPRPFDPLGRKPPRLGLGLSGRNLVESTGAAGVACLDGRRTAAAARIGRGQDRPGSQGAGLLWPAAGRY